jgi:hypothetical protein
MGATGDVVQRGRMGQPTWELGLQVWADPLNNTAPVANPYASIGPQVWRNHTRTAWGVSPHLALSLLDRWAPIPFLLQCAPPFWRRPYLFNRTSSTIPLRPYLFYGTSSTVPLLPYLLTCNSSTVASLEDGYCTLVSSDDRTS